jgi:hypothetical protein
MHRSFLCGHGVRDATGYGMSDFDDAHDRATRIQQMADAMIAHLGVDAQAFAAHQMRFATGEVLLTWTAIAAEIARR